MNEGPAMPGRDQLEQELEQLKQAGALKDKFISIIAHDLRNPMTGIKGYASLLRNAALDERQKKWVNIMIEQIDRLSQYINDILDILRAEEGRLNFNIDTVNLVSTVANAVNNFQARARAKEIALESELPGAPVMAAGNADRITQVLGNLLDNALKFTPPDGKIKVSVQTDGNEAIITIADTGPGISEEIAPHLFDKFQSANWKIKATDQGVGLGLPVSSRLIAYQKGRIEFTSVPGQGASFMVVLPLAV